MKKMKEKPSQPDGVTIEPVPSFLELALHVLGDHIGGDGVAQHTHQERERADPDQPGDQGAALGAKRLRHRRSEQARPRRRTVARRKQPAADVPPGRQRPGRH
jgi:hypothetical protein